MGKKRRCLGGTLMAGTTLPGNVTALAVVNKSIHPPPLPRSAPLLPLYRQQQCNPAMTKQSRDSARAKHYTQPTKGRQILGLTFWITRSTT